MSNRITFEVDEKEYSLHFGMDAYEVVTENSFNDTVKNQTSNFKMCVYIIWGGLINECILKRKSKTEYPTFEEAYLLTEKILEKGGEFENAIFDVWTDSVANREIMKMLDTVKKKAESVISQTGLNAGLLHTEN